jgi:hypothetical protein
MEPPPTTGGLEAAGGPVARRGGCYQGPNSRVNSTSPLVAAPRLDYP